MNILYVSDDNYAMQTGISMLSLLDNNREESVSIYIFSLGITKDNEQSLQTICDSYKKKIFFIKADSYIEKLRRSNLNTYRGSYSAAVRFGISELLPEKIDRVLYLDCDTLVVGNISALYNYNLKSKTIGMCYDCIRNERKKRLNFSFNEPYFNSGVLLIDIKKWKSNQYENIFLTRFDSIKDICYLPDQDGINILFKEGICPLPFAANILSQTLFYNYEGNCLVYKQSSDFWYSKAEFELGLENPMIYHFCGHSFIRPWYKNSKHPMKQKYNYYYNLSPWKDCKQQKFKWTLTRYLQYITRGNFLPLLYLNSFMQRIFILGKYHV